MELKLFIENVLTQLVEGVVETQKKVTSLGAVVNPQSFDKDSAKIGDKSRPVEIVEFEVGLTSSGSEETSAGVSVLLSVIGVGAKSAKEAHNEAVTRIKFSIPIALPTVDSNNTPPIVSQKRANLF
jgi:hypothetical protein